MSFRVNRVNAEIQKSVTDIIKNRLDNPKVTGLVTVMKVETTLDLTQSKIYLSIFGDKSKTEQCFEAIKESTAFIRRELAHDLKTMRIVPEIVFHMDKRFEDDDRINKIIEGLKVDKKN